MIWSCPLIISWEPNSYYAKMHTLTCLLLNYLMLYIFTVKFTPSLTTYYLYPAEPSSVTAINIQHSPQMNTKSNRSLQIYDCLLPVYTYITYLIIYTYITYLIIYTYITYLIVYTYITYLIIYTYVTYIYSLHTYWHYYVHIHCHHSSTYHFCHILTFPLTFSALSCSFIQLYLNYNLSMLYLWFSYFAYNVHFMLLASAWLIKVMTQCNDIKLYGAL